MRTLMAEVRNHAALKNQQQDGDSAVTPSRYTVKLILLSAFIGLLSLYIISISITYVRLLNINELLWNITAHSLPAASKNNKVHNQISDFHYLTNRLSNAKNLATLQIVEKNIEIKLNELGNTIIDNHKNLASQLTILTNVFTDLQTLVNNKIAMNVAIKEQQSQFYQEHNKLIALATTHAKVINNKHTIAWFTNLAIISNDVSQAITAERIQTVRQASYQISARIDLLTKFKLAFKTTQSKQLLKAVANLQVLLLAPDGLLENKIKQLQLNGRVIGRSNFVRNLVSDFKLSASFKSYKLNQSILAEAKNINHMILRDSRLIKIVTLVVIILSVIIVILIQQRIVKRITILNILVLSRLKGRSLNRFVGGNDEISDIQHSFQYFANKVDEQQIELEQLSVTDSLTGLINRRGLDQQLLQALQLAKRQHWPTALLMIDVDYFKKYNDSYGHLEGDECLREIAKLLMLNKRRANDLVARYGGEEFLIMLPNTDQAGAILLAEQTLNIIRERKIPHNTSDVEPFVTLSIGIAIIDPALDINTEAFLAQADTALYQAKANGRNQACWA